VVDASAAGYHGPPELTALRALSGWTADPWALTVLLLLGAVYLVGVARLRRSGIRWPIGRVVAFCAGGVGLALIATNSFLAVYGPVLFYVRAVQTVVLLLAVPLFLALGRPLSLVIATVPRLGSRLEAAARSRVAGAATFPAITSLVLVLTPFLFYFTAWYPAGLHDAAVREITYLALVLPGLIFFWTLLRVDPVPREFPYLVALWVTAAEVIGDAALGLAIIADRHLIAGTYYHQLARPWGPSLAADQVIGGGALWILGDLIGLPFLAAVLIVMIREDESQARAIDAELDAQEAAASAGAQQVAARPDAVQLNTAQPDTVQPETVQPETVQPETVQRPWWEADQRFRGRFAPVDTDPKGWVRPAGRRPAR
jgi:cytochrome c oxidase assembly factor CtaG